MNRQIALNVNLLKKKGTPNLDIFIHWAITGGRFIVILTETIALAAFLYRFSLDRQIVDLHDQINAKETIVAALKDQEVSYRELQQRILQTKQLSANVSFSTDLFTKITHLAQSANLTFETLQVSNNTLHIEVSTGDINDLKGFVLQLQNQKDLKEISIDRIDDRTTSAQISAVISAQIIAPEQKISGVSPTPTPGGSQ